MNKTTKYSFLIIGTMFAPLTTLAELIITGTTFETISNMGTDKIEYRILPNVKIIVTREGITLFDEPKLSDAQGVFTLKVPSGGPFKIVFRSDNKMPQIQQLAAIDTYKYNIAVVLEEKIQEITDSCKNFSTRDQEKITEKIKRYEFTKLQFESSNVENKLDDIKKLDDLIKTLNNISVMCQHLLLEPAIMNDKTSSNNNKKNSSNYNKNNDYGSSLNPPTNLQIR